MRPWHVEHITDDWEAFGTWRIREPVAASFVVGGAQTDDGECADSDQGGDPNVDTDTDIIEKLRKTLNHGVRREHREGNEGEGRKGEREGRRRINLWRTSVA